MRLALGTAQIGLAYGISNNTGQVSGDEATAIIREAGAAGIDTLDTAVAYGESESRLGKIGVDGFRIVSKVPAVPDDVKDIRGWMSGVVRDSLLKLRAERLYGLLLHRPQQLGESRGGEIQGALDQLKADGLADKTGISIYDPAELDELAGRYRPDLVQAPFNLFDNRLISSGWMSRLKAQGTEVHVRSIFLQGVLLFAPDERPKKFDRWAAQFAAYDEWMSAHNRSALEACVSHALSVPEIDRVVVGVESASHLRDVVAAAAVSPPPFAERVVSSDAELLDPRAWNYQPSRST
ncbi:MAG TPA: aldo/keto reductase [Gemmatimonadaceae bacterium]|nr:aldo/keto reductase [Gemmatimonadaceae bacterium]